MARFKVLVSAPYFFPVVDRYRARFENADCELVIADVEERLSEEELLPIIGEIDGALCGDDCFSERVLRAAESLKVISKWGTGIDSIDKEAAERLGIAVRNTRNVFAAPVADTAMGYILCFARSLPWMDREVKAGTWAKIPGVSLRECTLGVIGVGNIGKAVVRRARAFGMRVLGNDIVEIETDFLHATDLEMVDKERLLRQSDFVSLHCDLNPTSYHLISSSELELMKASARLLNTARGPIIDEKALVRALA